MSLIPRKWSITLHLKYLLLLIGRSRKGLDNRCKFVFFVGLALFHWNILLVVAGGGTREGEPIERQGEFFMGSVVVVVGGVGGT
jgi:hypothetical protein